MIPGCYHHLYTQQLILSLKQVVRHVLKQMKCCDKHEILSWGKLNSDNVIWVIQQKQKPLHV